MNLTGYDHWKLASPTTSKYEEWYEANEERLLEWYCDDNEISYIDAPEISLDDIRRSDDFSNYAADMWNTEVGSW